LNHPGDIRSSLAYGIDGFFTDDPALARRTLQDAA
jgi:glycerophosphoryl diester phosphodiesterase